MLVRAINWLFRLGERIYRISHSELPRAMRKDITRAELQLSSSSIRTLPNPIQLMGYSISYFNVNQLRYLFAEIFINGSYLFHTDRSRPLILDCGSNIGMSILFFKKLYPEARIIGFEADPLTFE